MTNLIGKYPPAPFLDLSSVLSSHEKFYSFLVGVRCNNGHPYPIYVFSGAQNFLRSFSSKVSVLRAPANRDPPSGGGEDDSGSKGSDKTPGESFGSSGSGSGKGTNKDKGGGNNSHLSCPKCGDPCTRVETFVCKYLLLILDFLLDLKYFHYSRRMISSIIVVRLKNRFIFEL